MLMSGWLAMLNRRYLFISVAKYLLIKEENHTTLMIAITFESFLFSPVVSFIAKPLLFCFAYFDSLDSACILGGVCNKKRRVCVCSYEEFVV
jgi:hypothetical protein